MNNLLNEHETILCEYWEFSNKMEKILHDIEEVRLPIDMTLVARKLGFNVISYKETSNELYGYVKEKEIRVSSNLFYKKQRWTIAKAIAMHHLGKSGDIVNPFLVNYDIDTVTADSLAILIVLPISLFKKDLSEYKSNVDCFDGNKYLDSLCNRAQISMFHLSFGYHILTQMLCFQRQKAFREVRYDITKFEKDEFENIYF